MELLHDQPLHSWICISKTNENIQWHKNLYMNSHSSTIPAVKSRTSPNVHHLRSRQIKGGTFFSHKKGRSTGPNWVNLGSMLSQRIQTQKTTCCMYALVWNIWNGSIYGDKEWIGSCLPVLMLRGDGEWPLIGQRGFFFWSDENALKLIAMMVYNLVSILKTIEVYSLNGDLHGMWIRPQ